MALTNILVIQYNNYFNRTIKQPSNPENITSYYDPLTSYYDVAQNVNFYKGDGVNTELTFSTTKSGIDYLIEYNSEGTVLSRWFIIENMQTRSGQSKLTLRRDVIIDNIDNVLEAPIYVEKATINNIEDVAIYNQEELALNQIKITEEKLMDGFQTPWIVGYYANNTPATSATTTDIQFDAVHVDDLESWSYYSYISNDYKILLNDNTTQFFHMQWIGHASIETVSTNYYVEPYGNTYDNELGTLLSSKKNVKEQYNQMKTIIKENATTCKNLIVNKFGLQLTNNISSLNNSFLYDDSTNKIYRISIVDKGITESTDFYDKNSLEESTVSGLFSSLSLWNYPTAGNKAVRYYYQSHNYRIVLEETKSVTYTITVPATTRKLSDAPYKMFAIPAYSINDNTAQKQTLDYLNVLNITSSLATSLGTNLYDIQLLPYSPIRNIIDFPGSIEYNTFSENIDYTKIVDNDNNYKGIVFFPSNSTFSFDINKTISLPNNIVDRKIIGQCDMYRLSSPNYAAMFDFNLLKTGSITKFNVDCTYKPYSPYIHINPNWTKLYGNDFDDTRGLICQGDFSLPIISDAWKQYQINNKNYLNAFNRQIDSIELNNKYQRLGKGLNAITGVASGAIAGAVLGGGVGAVLGGAASLAGGFADMAINDKLRRDSLDLTRDQFNFNIQNIKALPNTISKVSSLDANNKLFPILSYYSCTQQEKDILKLKFKYNGMSIMRIDKLDNFISNTEQYFKGKVIRLDDIAEDYHMANSIADELNKGVFIKL